jgi:Pentapeptide repeats (8 copies)
MESQSSVTLTPSQPLVAHEICQQAVMDTLLAAISENLMPDTLQVVPIFDRQSDRYQLLCQGWTAIAGVLIAFAVGFSGWWQYQATTAQQKSDSADKERETKEQVLTDYGKSISELVTKYKLGKKSDESVKNTARGQTFIALRRLDPGDKPKDDKDDKSKDDKGKLKGLLIRYLYDANLIGYDCRYVKYDANCDANKKKAIEPNFEPNRVEGVMDLFGANITKVVLEDAWLPNLDLPKTWLNEANFKNTYLMGASLYQASLINADFTGADLSDADFTSADLRFANLKTAKNLNPAKFQNACYVEGTEAKYFPDGFDLVKAGMIAIAKNQSDPSNSNNFERCKYVFLGARP